MKIYRVGGAVRDALLGLPVKDIDYVVLGSTPEEMVAAGYTPVGKDFPVFLHPQTRAEYALARTERKTAPGYHGFIFHCSPDVTIEQDLERRDLTINAMAIAEDTHGGGEIIDPFNGQKDLANKLFRHVSAAFAEDPVRILRVARFAARFNTFTVAPETMQLMRGMVNSGEVDSLVPERVWQEIAGGLLEAHPSRMMAILHESGALARIMPELDALWNTTAALAAPIEADANLPMRSGEHMMQVIDYAAQRGFSVAVRWAAMQVELNRHAENNSAECHEVNTTGVNLARQLCARLKIPTELRDISLIALRESGQIVQGLNLQPESVVQLLERCDAFRRPTRFVEILQAVLCNYFSLCPSCFSQQVYLEHALVAAQAIPSAQIARATAQRFPNQPQQIAAAITAARVEAIRQMPPCRHPQPDQRIKKI